jgi:hypothetical protein
MAGRRVKTLLQGVWTWWSLSCLLSCVCDYLHHLLMIVYTTEMPQLKIIRLENI